MEPNEKKELAQNIWCALNASTTNEETIEIMNLVEEAAKVKGLSKWQEYVDNRKDIRTTSLKRIKELLTPKQ